MGLRNASYAKTTKEVLIDACKGQGRLWAIPEAQPHHTGHSS